MASGAPRRSSVAARRGCGLARVPARAGPSAEWRECRLDRCRDQPLDACIAGIGQPSRVPLAPQEQPRAIPAADQQSKQPRQPRPALIRRRKAGWRRGDGFRLPAAKRCGRGLIDRRGQGRLPRQRIGRRQRDCDRARWRGRRYRPRPDRQWRGIGWRGFGLPRAVRRAGAGGRSFGPPGHRPGQRKVAQFLGADDVGRGRRCRSDDIGRCCGLCCAASGGKARPASASATPHVHIVTPPIRIDCLILLICPGIWRSPRRTGDEWRAHARQARPLQAARRLKRVDQHQFGIARRLDRQLVLAGDRDSVALASTFH